jgi:hypothetical protein
MVRTSRSKFFTLSPFRQIWAFFIAFFFLYSLATSNLCAAEVTLAWEPNNEPDLSGYRIFVREEGQDYDYQSPAWEGTATTCSITGLNDFTVYCFVARAFDTSNNESGDSHEVCYSPNRPPVLDTVGAKAVEEGQSLEFSVSANDPDGDSLSYAAANLPRGASFDAAAQRFSWTPGFGAAGNYNVTFTVTDDGSPSQSDSEQVTSTVGDVNRPPVLNSIGAKTVNENVRLEFVITASDPDGDNLTYAAANLPIGASFDAAAQRFSWTPGFGTAGNYNVSFTVTDDGSPPQSDSEEVIIDVFGDDEAPGAPTDLEIVGM